MKSPHLVIVTYNWPPRNAIGTHRPYAWAKAWSSLGRRATVLTAKKYAFDAPLDLDLPPLPDVDVIEVAWGGTTDHLGLRLLGNEHMRALARRLRASLSKYSAMPVEPRKGWLSAALPTAKSIAAEADIVISTFGPAMSHQLGAAMKQTNPKLLWVADYRDLWSQAHLGNLTARQRTRINALERETVGAHADMLSAVSEDMVRQLSDLTEKPILLVPNGFDLDETTITTRILASKQRRRRHLRIVHTGSLNEGERNPTPLLQALVELERDGDIRIGDVSIEFYGARIDVARSLAKHSEYSPFINLIGHVPREQALKAQQDADLLLLLESPKPAARGVLTGKVFEYLVAGSPILSLGSLKCYEIPRLLAQTKTGISYETHEIKGLKNLILELLNSTQQPSFFKPDIDFILRYSRIRQSIQFFEKLDELNLSSH
jgi:hypothetical protein